MKRTLHIVDGESAGGSLRHAGFHKNGVVLPWLDALDAGPVPGDLPLRRLSKLRSRFWTRTRTDEFDARDAALASCRNYDGIVLWFGATSVCQLSLLQLLSWFSAKRVDLSRMRLVTADAGSLREEQLHQAYAARQPVTSAQIRLACRAWDAFRSPSPDKMSQLLRSDLRTLPDLRDTVEYLLQEYPDVQDGLSRLERKLLRAVHSLGAAPASFAAAEAIIQYHVGDLLLFDRLRRLLAGVPHPLLCFSQPFLGRFGTHEFHPAPITLTDTGRAVLAGKLDHVRVNGIDRWIGGVHLDGHHVRWRWDQRRHRIVTRS